MEQKPQFEKRYHLTMKEFEAGFLLFQKKFVYPKNYFMSAVFLVVAGVYVQSLIQKPDSLLAYILIFICLLLAYNQLKNPKAVRNRLLKAVEGIENDLYILTAYEDRIELVFEVEESDVKEPESLEEEKSEPEEEKSDAFDLAIAEAEAMAETVLPKEEAEKHPTVLIFANHVTMIEGEEIYILYETKQMFYVLPKRVLEESDLEILRGKIRIKK